MRKFYDDGRWNDDFNDNDDDDDDGKDDDGDVGEGVRWLTLSTLEVHGSRKDHSTIPRLQGALTNINVLKSVYSNILPAIFQYLACKAIVKTLGWGIFRVRLLPLTL